MLLKQIFVYILNILQFIKLLFNSSHSDGYNIFGYVSKVIGQGEVVRAFADELIQSGRKFELIDIITFSHAHIDESEKKKYAKYYSRNLKYNKNIYFVDLFFLSRIKKIIPSLFQSRYNIAVFWWEFESGCEERLRLLNDYDEVYVFSDFLKNILLNYKERNFIVTKIKFPFRNDWVIEEQPDKIRKDYDLKDKFCFFFNFDYYSSYNRKNPEAILYALIEEFPLEKDVVLVLKTTGASVFHEKSDHFFNLVNNTGLGNRVILIDKSLSRNQFMSLLNSMDCYISLHRGEGLGLGILEALALNKPVIATNYGGNVEYMDNSMAYPVNYKLVPAEDDSSIYKNVKLWAEPDISDAKIYMRKVYNKYIKVN
jgi:glycosyltransferase involved in cell wall biosynthesis